MQVKVSERVLKKMRQKHGVEPEEVAQCFLNRSGKYYTDTREDHRTDPPTYWFVAETDKGRVLKIVFVRHPESFAIKSAFEPKDGSDRLYQELEEGR